LNMLVAKIDVHGGEELLVNRSKNRIVILEKTDMQKRFEKWLKSDKKPPCYLKKKPTAIKNVSTKDLQMRNETRRG
jgi:hypothetical protein